MCLLLPRAADFQGLRWLGLAHDLDGAEEAGGGCAEGEHVRLAEGERARDIRRGESGSWFLGRKHGLAVKKGLNQSVKALVGLENQFAAIARLPAIRQ